MMQFDTKDAARDWAWQTLTDEGAARFPYPVEGRIPNFEGAEAAAERLIDHPLLTGADRIKCNPDSPQKHLREAALRRGITVYVPTPRLKGGFMRFDPADIPEENYDDASMLSRWDPFADSVPLEELPQMDAIVTGCVAVTRQGKRCGKGEGFSDLEFAILRELGHDPVPVATTVHDLQVVDDFPVEDHDLGLLAIATPEELIEVDEPAEGPAGIDWDLLSEEDLDEMPILRELE